MSDLEQIRAVLRLDRFMGFSPEVKQSVLTQAGWLLSDPSVSSKDKQLLASELQQVSNG